MNTDALLRAFASSSMPDEIKTDPADATDVLARLTRSAELFRRGQVPADLGARWTGLPAGQRAALGAFIGQGVRTYREASEAAGVSVNTLKTQLRRLRLAHPALWSEVLSIRAAQLVGRHEQSVTRLEARSRAWHRKQANRRYRQRFGVYPWERRC